MALVQRRRGLTVVIFSWIKMASRVRFVGRALPADSSEMVRGGIPERFRVAGTEVHKVTIAGGVAR